MNRNHNQVLIIEKDYSIRSNWMLAEVSLFSPCRVSKFVDGLITIPSASGCVDDELLGDNFVGVLVMEVHSLSDFPKRTEGVALLMRWSIYTIKLKCNDLFLGDILKEKAEAAALSRSRPSRS